MMTKAFEDAIVTALLRISGMTPEHILSNLNTMYPLCKLIEYNETNELDEKSDAERLLVFSRNTALPEHLQGVRSRANTFVNNNAGFRTFFKTSTPNAKSILYVCLSLHMTVDEINSVLLSYSLQTISWHRVEDLLLRYAVEKGWGYATFLHVMKEYHTFLKHAETGQNGAPPQATESPSDVDSSYLTRQNISLFYNLFAGSASDYTIFKKFHELFAPIERSSSGAPRRTFLRMVRLLQGCFSRYIAVGDGEEAAYKEINFNDCRKTRVQSSYFMLYEAAGMLLPDVAPNEAKSTLDGVIHAINELMRPPTLRQSARIGLPSAWFDTKTQAAYVQKVRAAWENSLLDPSFTLHNTTACDLILRVIDRDLPQNLRNRFHAGNDQAEPTDRRMLQIAQLVQPVYPGNDALERSYRGSLFTLLLRCGCTNILPLLAADIEQLMRCFGFAVLSSPLKESPESIVRVANALGYTEEQLMLLRQHLDKANTDKRNRILHAVFLPQTIVRDHITNQLNQVLDIFNQNRRNSEPSFGFLMLLAAYTFGYAVGSNRSIFNSARAERYVQDRLRDAWSDVSTEYVHQSTLYKTVVQLMHNAFNLLNGRLNESEPFAAQWIDALHAACKAHASTCHQTDLMLIRNFVTYSSISSIASSNPLSSVSIVSHGWTL